MKVASFRAVGPSPENDAWAMARAWAEPRGLLDDTERYPVYGFNSPDRGDAEGEYGYEFWIRVDPDFEPEGEVEVKAFEGGLYAVTACKLMEEATSDFFQEEGYLESWGRLDDWVKANQYRRGPHQSLEKPRDPLASQEDLVLDLHYPIVE
jgi:DNA gyrase inhibitor GyrI